ncbi:MAG TPA: four helix bundle protein [Victivallales bacterium]|nr:four helix bundle protein [Victivallales bacterium]
MIFGHENLDVYKLSLTYVKWALDISETLKGKHRSTRDQLIRASQSIPLNIAEGNGKTSDGDRKRFFEISRGSALECAAIQDILEIGGAISKKENEEAKQILSRIVSMLTKLAQREYSVRKNGNDYDNDYDSDSDSEAKE